ncbi:MAG: diadenylate cyclase CdaA [Phycisphaerales bacterium]|nr:diadenylate cyclase CdaA [Phycisphaerales bacterium]MCB9840331.1 TIGR00159 family protein [Phycisphaeraceae bacterium]
MNSLLDNIRGVIARLGSYDPWEVAFELLIIWVGVYAITRFVQGTRAAGALKGLLVLLVLLTLVGRVLAGDDTFPRLRFLYDRLLTVVAVGLIVIFAPELRRAAIRIGEAPFFRSTPGEIAALVDEVAEACKFLSKARFGAIMVFERQIGLQAVIESATRINADVTARLLQTIFYPGSALHDLAVVIKGGRIAAASVQLPLADPAEMPDPNLGSRHRAAVGISRDCDAVVVIVSEETGAIRIAERGRLSAPLEIEDLKAQLSKRLEAPAAQKRRRLAATDDDAPTELDADRRTESPDSSEDSLSGEAGLPTTAEKA